MLIQDLDITIIKVGNRRILQLRAEAADEIAHAQLE
jgi:hypothetical protein